MAFYIIIETDEGLAVAGVPENSTPEAVAKDAGGVLIDEGPYDTFEKAHDVLMTLPNPYEADRPS